MTMWASDAWASDAWASKCLLSICIQLVIHCHAFGSFLFCIVDLTPAYSAPAQRLLSHQAYQSSERPRLWAESQASHCSFYHTPKSTGASVLSPPLRLHLLSHIILPRQSRLSPICPQCSLYLAR